MSTPALRHLPSIDALLRRAGLREAIALAGRASVRDRLREVLAEIRSELRDSNGLPASVLGAETLAAEIERRAMERLAQRAGTLTRRVINATGVVLHTNLGRAPLGARARATLDAVASGYCNLEYDLATGGRGRRGAGLEALLRELCGAEAALVVNNCAAAVLLVLNTLAEGGEVIVSRGELIEIGGSFRLPEVIAKSGARLREVGTTNRTRLSDYERAINPETRAILRAHPSNYRLVGFTERPSLGDLAPLARARGLALFEDLGSGSLLELSACGIHGEPTVGAAIAAGVSVIAFSGDKLLGGPQAGIILGVEEVISRLRTNPLLRALRVDKLTYAALEATLEAYAAGRAREELPVLAALHATAEEIASRARSLIRRARSRAPALRFNLSDGHSVVGGGAAPETQLPTKLIAIASPRESAAELAAALRRRHLPVIARILDDRLVLDLRTVSREEERDLLEAITAIGNHREDESTTANSAPQ
jgi:L-seryl-tRNA(Ser) seleniumtransferase